MQHMIRCLLSIFLGQVRWYGNKQVNELLGCRLMDMKQILSHKHRHQYSYRLSTELSPSPMNNGSVILPYITFNGLSRAKDCACPWDNNRQLVDIGWLKWDQRKMGAHHSQRLEMGGFEPANQISTWWLAGSIGELIWFKIDTQAM